MRSRLLMSFLIVALISRSMPVFAAAPPSSQGPAPGMSAQGNTPAQNGEEAVEPKFFLLGAIASEVFSMFAKWAMSKLIDASSISIPANSWFGSLKLVDKSPGEGGTPPATVSGPPVSSKGIEDYRSNYQGVHFAIAVLDPEGKNLVMRPLNEGFKSGERFKLRVVSTFTGDMKIENINPKGERKLIYPPDDNLRVRLEAGREALIPAEPDSFFEFTRATGREQLIITLRDPRATEANMSHATVFRQDDKFGSNFVQEVPNNTYAVISESVDLRHF